MKATWLLVSFAALSLLPLYTIPPCDATVITFDDIPNAVAPFPLLTNGYQSLNWSNLAVLNGVLESQLHGVNGGYYGMVSPSNVAFDTFGYPAEIDARGTNFDFLGAYLTGAWNSNLNVEIQGFRNGSLLYDQIVVLAATSSTQLVFDYLNIDRLTFNSFGGDSAGFTSGGGETFVMDNFNFEFVPEPSSLLLAALASVSLVAFLRRKHLSNGGHVRIRPTEGLLG